MNTVTTRLKRISNAEDSAVIPSSHKWTEMGMLPKDWSVRSLRSCLLSAPSYGINEAAVPFDDDLPTYLRITDISEEGQFRPSPRVSVKHPNGQAFFLNEGDLVLARTGASVGKSYLYNPKDGPLVFAGFLIRISPNPENLQPTFLAYYLQSKYYWNWVATMSIRSGQPGINGKEYGELQLPLPPLSEQRAIAEALSDIDGLLNALDALIAKKQAIKQATMQQLLTGKTRLPGFSGAWETKQIGDVVNLCSEKNNLGADIPVLTCSKHLGFVDSLSYFKNQVFSKDLSGYKIIRRGQIGYPINHVEEGSIGLQDLYDAALVSPIYVVCSPKKDINSFFLHRLLKLESYRQEFANATTSSINRRGSLRWPVFSKIHVTLPSIDEQVAIAAVLNDVETEIASLEKRRDKTRAIKQGMMQQLLTGRVRLFESRIIADNTDDAD